MNKYMNDEEFCNCSSIDDKLIYSINDDLNERKITKLSNKLEYVKENYGGQFYLYFMLKEFDDKILMNYHEVSDKFTFSKDAIDGLLRSYLFAVTYMQDRLPEHAYNYIKSKVSTFVYELDDSLK